MSCGIYKIENLINGKIYIGQSINIEKRFKQHIYNDSNMAIHRAIVKYGADNFDMSIVELCDKELLDEKEIYWIEYYDSFNNGYNNTTGGGCERKKYTNHMKPVLQLDKEYNILQVYPSIANATIITGINPSSICSVCKHNKKDAGGFYWRYQSDIAEALKEKDDIGQCVSEKDIIKLCSVSIDDIQKNVSEVQEIAKQMNIILIKRGKLYYAKTV